MSNVLLEQSNEIINQYKQASAKFELLNTQKHQVEKEREELKQNIQNSEKAAFFLLMEVKERRKEITDSIAGLSSAVLPNMYGIGTRIFFQEYDSENKAGKAAFKMGLRLVTPAIDDDGQPFDIVTGFRNEAGGSNQEATGLTIRLATIDVIGYQGPIIFDEICTAMSNDGKLDVIGEYIQEYCRQTNRQIIWCTHKGELKQFADHILHITNDNGNAKVTYVEDKDAFEMPKEKGSDI